MAMCADLEQMFLIGFFAAMITLWPVLMVLFMWEIPAKLRKEDKLWD